MTTPTPNLVEIDPEYEQRMSAFAIDCDNGKGDAWACHSVGEYHAVVKVRKHCRIAHIA